MIRPMLICTSPSLLIYCRNANPVAAGAAIRCSARLKPEDEFAFLVGTATVCTNVPRVWG
jgi:hypothetical protein